MNLEIPKGDSAGVMTFLSVEISLVEIRRLLTPDTIHRSIGPWRNKLTNADTKDEFLMTAFPILAQQEEIMPRLDLPCCLLLRFSLSMSQLMSLD